MGSLLSMLTKSVAKLNLQASDVPNVRCDEGLLWTYPGPTTMLPKCLLKMVVVVINLLFYVTLPGWYLVVSQGASQDTWNNSRAVISQAALAFGSPSLNKGGPFQLYSRGSMIFREVAEIEGVKDSGVEARFTEF